MARIVPPLSVTRINATVPFKRDAKGKPTKVLNLVDGKPVAIDSMDLQPCTQLTDGKGLFLKLQWNDDGTAAGNGHPWLYAYVSPTRVKNGKPVRTQVSFGAYPDVSLERARELHEVARGKVMVGIDPAEDERVTSAQEAAATAEAVRAAERKAAKLAPAGTLLGVAQDMKASREGAGKWTTQHATQWLGMITRCVPEHIAYLPIAEVRSHQILDDVIRPLEKAEKDATALSLRRKLGELFDYAERMELRMGNPARVIRADCKKESESEKIGNNPGALRPQELRRVLLAIRGWNDEVTRAALQVQAALAQRPGDTCAMKWADVHLDLDLNTWRELLDDEEATDCPAGAWLIPVERRTKLANSLKGAEVHIIPLPRQVVAVLRQLKPLTGHSDHVFLSTAGTGKAITNDTLTNALRSAGLGGVQSAHGFRATMRTMAPKVLAKGVGEAQYVEAQLGHAIGLQTVDGRMVRDVLGRAYNRATWIAERTPLVQGWADYLDNLLTDNALAAEPLKLAA